MSNNRKRESLPIKFVANPPQSAGAKNGKVIHLKGRKNLQLSEKSDEFLRIRRLVNEVPDIRLSCVNRLAKAIDQGTYDVKSEQIAEAIIQKHLIDL